MPNQLTNSTTTTTTPVTKAMSMPTWFLSGQLDPTDPVRRISINSSPFIVGRRGDCPLSISSNSVSKQHAELYQDGERLVLRDLSSTNGTYVNGEKVHETVDLNEGDLVQFATAVFRVSCTVNTHSENTIEENACDRALALMQFDRLINDGGLLPYYQPIVRMSDCRAIGYEVLGRSRLFGLKTPDEMFAAASELSLEGKLSESFRHRGVEEASHLPNSCNLFLNTHPVELGTSELIDSLTELRKFEPEQEITLEIHEAAVTNLNMMRTLRSVLTELNINLAFDDFGEGRARLVELGDCKPNYVKFDMNLTRCISRATSERQGIVATIANLVKELGIIVLAEGVESVQDHEVLVEMGFDLGQGFYYGRPAKISDYDQHFDQSMPINPI